MFNDFVTQFHLLRPEWLLALIPVIILLLWLRFEKAAQGDWHQIIPEHLLKHLLHEKPGGSSKQALTLLSLLWVLSVVALAGPTWQKLAQPVYEKMEARVYVLDLSFSMYASDIKPDRISRARLKLMDFLNEKKEGLSALVVFSGDAHIVTPLTNDTKTIISLVNSLEPGIMPDMGSNAGAGVQKALELLNNTKVDKGEIILLSDEITPPQVASINALMSNTDFRLSILGIGTLEGAPIKLPNGKFFKHEQQIIIPKLNRSEMKSLAENHGGKYVDLKQDDSDIDTILKQSFNEQESKEGQQEFDVWFDSGQWLMLPILLLAAFAFRKGWILFFPVIFSIGLSFTLFPTENAYAQSEPIKPDSNIEKSQNGFVKTLEENIAPWFLTGDQRGVQKFKQQEFQEAAKLFNHQNWKAASLFYSGQFAQASETFQAESADTPENQSSTWYNKANALAFAGDLDKALKAYDKAIELNPDNEDAKHNKELVEELKRMQKKNQQESQSQESQENDTDEQNQDSEQKQQQDQNQQTDDSSQENTSGENTQDQAENKGEQQQNQQNDNTENSESENSENSQEEKTNENNNANESENNQDSEEQSQEESQETSERSQSSDQQPNQGEDLMSPEEREEQQALEQWLRQVPDDPSGLLRRKFQLEYQRQGKKHSDEQQLW